MVPRGGLSGNAWEASKINNLTPPQYWRLYQQNVPLSIAIHGYLGPQVVSLASYRAPLPRDNAFSSAARQKPAARPNLANEIISPRNQALRVLMKTDVRRRGVSTPIGALNR
jgi:hypothetical protein